MNANKRLSISYKQLIATAKDFANELTSHNVIEKDLNKPVQISQEHVDNNKAVRDILLQRGVRPEALPPSEDVKKLERRLDSDEKKASKGTR
jgi:DNA-damage-inducible protein D